MYYLCVVVVAVFAAVAGWAVDAVDAPPTVPSLPTVSQVPGGSKPTFTNTMTNVATNTMTNTVSNTPSFPTPPTVRGVPNRSIINQGTLSATATSTTISPGAVDSRGNPVSTPTR